MKTATTKIAYLHHSTGEVVWLGSTSKIGVKLGKSAVGNWITDYNKKNGTRYGIEQMNFPNTTGGYPWANYPYDYYNIWVKNAGDTPYQGEPTLEMLTKQYDVIVWKHCFPVGNILPDTGTPDVDSRREAPRELQAAVRGAEGQDALVPRHHVHRLDRRRAD